MLSITESCVLVKSVLATVEQLFLVPPQNHSQVYQKFLEQHFSNATLLRMLLRRFCSYIFYAEVLEPVGGSMCSNKNLVLSVASKLCRIKIQDKNRLKWFKKEMTEKGNVEVIICLSMRLITD